MKKMINVLIVLVVCLNVSGCFKQTRVIPAQFEKMHQIAETQNIEIFAVMGQDTNGNDVKVKETVEVNSGFWIIHESLLFSEAGDE